MTPLLMKFFFFQKQFMLSKYKDFYTIILQENFGLVIHFMVFTQFQNMMSKLWSASQDLFAIDS